MASCIIFEGADRVPLTFEDLWYALNVIKRASLLDYMAQDDGVSAVTLGYSLSRLDHQDGTFLVDLLVECSMVQFSLYVKICSIDRYFDFEDQLVGKDDITTDAFGHLPEWEVEIKATLDSYWNATSSDTSTTDALDKLEHSPEDPVEKAASSSLTAFEPADPQLRQLIHNLPSELLLLIQDDFLHIVFGPRRIYPYNERSNVDVFQALDHQLLAKYQRIFYRDNIWVIGQGDYDDGIGFLDLMPIVLHDSIRKVEMSFTTHDHLHSSLDFYFAEDAQDTRNALEILRSYRHECAGFACELTMTWWQKFYAVAFLHLDYCTLDFSEAYAPDGEYLGVQVARVLIPFCYGLPAEFFINAPTQDLADEIWDILVWNNP